MNLFADLLILFLLLMLNGVFAMAEIAVVSSRKARLKKLADEGSTRASVALALANSPDRFLSTVQIGITLVGVLAGAFGGAALSDEFEPMIAAIPVLAPYAGIISIALVVGAITYLSLVIGELDLVDEVLCGWGPAHPEGEAARRDVLPDAAWIVGCHGVGA
jgi:putative hemolysin